MFGRAGRRGERLELSVWLVQDPAQHNHLLPRDFPSRLARAREERARFVSLSLSPRSWHVSVEATRAAPEAPLPQPRPSRRPARHACQCRDSRFVLRQMPGQSAKAPHLRAAAARRVPDPRGQNWGALGKLRSILQDPRTRTISPGTGEGDHRVLPLRCPSRSDSSPQG